MYTIDASVWVNSFDQREPGHVSSRQLLEVIRAQALPIIVPNLALAEVAGAISRTRNDPIRAQAFSASLEQLPNVTVMPLNAELGQRALELAAQHGLRGADAVYAAVAHQVGSTLISRDNEHLTRLNGIITVCTPEAALSDLTPPSETSSTLDPCDSH
jgi:predicted nucleic acid-binding protein